MSRNRWRFSKSTTAIGIFGLAVGLLAGLTGLIYGQTASQPPVGMPEDWTHHHVVFSNPGTAAEALAQGRYEQWSKIVNDPRYILQQMKRNPAQRALATAPDFATPAVRLREPLRDPRPIRIPPRPTPDQSLKEDWSESMLSGVAASQTGTFTASSGSGTVLVNTTTLTASTGTAASQSTTINTNGFTSGSTITITNPLNSSSLQLIASTPVAEEGQFQFTGSPLPNDNVKIAGIYYEFETPPWTSGSMSANTCYIAIGTTINMVSWLASAITTGSANGGTSGTSTWQCGTTANQPPAGVTVTSSTSPNVDVTANIPGSTGFKKTLNSAAITFTTPIPGSDGSTTSPYFVWSADSVAVSQAQVATNIYTAIGTANAVGVGATNPSSGVVVITATLTGLAGNSISVATSISSGDLSGGKFAGDLSGGGAGTTSDSGKTFSTSTDSTTESTNLDNEATALAGVIAYYAGTTGVTATSNGAVVTATDTTTGPSGNSIAVSASLTGFSWAGTTLANGTTATVQPNTYPAKFGQYGASLTTASCSDFVVYPTGAAGSASTASIIAFNNLYVGSSPACGSGPTVYWAYNTNGGTVSTSPILYTDGVQVAFIQVTGTVASLVVLKSAQGSSVSVNSPTSFTSTTQTYSGSGVTGGCSTTSGSPTVSCTGTSVNFTNAEDLGAAVTVTGFTGTQVITAVDSTTEITLSGNATTTESAGTVTITVAGFSGTSTGFVSPANYPSCTAPCMTSLALNGGSSGSPNDTYSAPFYDYASDNALYVGDNSSNLHKFTGVFAGTPTEVTPVTLNSTAYAVSSPVYDPTSGCVFVGDSEGYLYSVSSGVAGSVCTGNSFALYGKSENLGDGGANEGILDGPLVDPTAGMVYAFITDSAAIGSCAAGDNCVVQFTTSSITSGSTTAAPNAQHPLGTGGAGFYLYSGTFDNAYFYSQSLTPSSPTGNLWVAGNTGTAGGATLYRIPITSNAMGTPLAAVTGLSTTDYAYPSPVTEFCNNGTSGCNVTGGTDYLYFSVYGSTLTAHSTTCGASGLVGCVLDYNITYPGSPTLAGVYPIVAVPAYQDHGCWVTGGFVIDNSATTTGAAQVYFINLNGNEAGGPNGATSTACTSGSGNTIQAVQASQPALE
jgi:hypothetical protein